MIMIILPWFPEGDPLSPPEVSLLHRFAGDYYQTYDLFFSQDQTINPRQYVTINRPNVGPPILLPANQTLAVEWFTPVDFPRTKNWLETYYVWQDAWRRIQTQDRQVERLELDVIFPIVLDKDCRVEYLTFDYNFNQEVPGARFEFYSRIYETIKAGQEWTPRYSPVHNSLEFDQEIDLGNNATVLSASQWCLPYPTSERKTIIGIREIRTEIFFENQSTYQINTLNQTSCQLSERETEVEVIAFGINFNAAQAFIENTELRQGNCFFDNVTGFGVANTIGLEDFAVLVFGIGGGVLARFDTVAEAQAQGFDVPDQDQDPFYFVRIERSEAPELNCQQVLLDQTIVTRDEQNVETDTFDPFEDKYFCIVPANNNYWGFQGLPVPLGIIPNLWLPDNSEDTNPIKDLVLGISEDQIRVPTTSFGFANELSEFDEEIYTIDFTYYKCFGLSDQIPVGDFVTETFQSGLRRREYNVQKLTQTGFFIQTRYSEITNSEVVDQYYLANNGSEFEVTMPDSIRLKEIHRALDAGVYGDGTIKQDPLRPLFVPDTEDSALFKERVVDDPNFEVSWSTLPDFINQRLRFTQILLGLDLLPLDRPRTYKPFQGSIDSRKEEVDTLISVMSYLVSADRENQLKLGLWPQVAYNYAKLNEDGDPEAEVYPGLADLVCDIFSLLTRTNLVSERASLSAYRTDINVIEVARAIGSPFVRKEVPWDNGGLTDVLEYAGAASIAAALFDLALHVYSQLPGDLPEEFYELIEQRRAELEREQT